MDAVLVVAGIWVTLNMLVLAAAWFWTVKESGTTGLSNRHSHPDVRDAPHDSRYGSRRIKTPVPCPRSDPAEPDAKPALMARQPETI
jgi:hypothetical protein